jgi:excisionase family DNA binding protein
MNKLLRGEDVAEILSISKAFAYRLMAERRIPTVRIGRAVRVRPEDLELFTLEATAERRP